MLIEGKTNAGIITTVWLLRFKNGKNILQIEERNDDFIYCLKLSIYCNVLKIFLNF